jgi:hypothetical protein
MTSLAFIGSGITGAPVALDHRAPLLLVAQLSGRDH